MAMILSRLLPATAGLMLLIATSAVFAQTAGRIEFALGDVRIRSAEGVERPAAKGGEVQVGETVVTGAQGQAQVRMIDNAFLAVRPDSEVVVNQYHFVGHADGQESAVLRLIKGTMRAFTGQIAQINRDKVVTTTPTATIGVRGTGNIAHYSPNLGTLNHTIEGSHVVSSVNAQGQVIGTPIITLPGDTIQVVLNQAPIRIPTPPFLLQAATTAPTTAAKPTAQAAQAAQNTGTGGTATRSTSTADTALTTGSPTTVQTTTTAVTTTTTPPPNTVITGTTGGSTTVNLTTKTVSTGTSTTTLTSGGTTISGTPTTLVPPPLSQLGTEAGMVFLGAPSSFTSGGTTSPPQPFSPNYAQAMGVHFDAIGDKVAFGGPNGNLSSGTSTNAGSDAYTVSIVGVTTGASSVTTLPNGISFGSYAGRNMSGVGPALQVTESGVSSGQPFSSTFDVVGNLQWIVGPGVWPVLASSVLTGTLTFGSFTGPPPTDQNGVTGTLNSASLAVNFDRQSVNAAVNATIGSNNWVATANNITMQNSGHFSANTFAQQGSQGSHQTLNLTLNGAPVGNSTTSTTTTTSGGGRLEGALTGPFMSGAGIGYAFEQMTFGATSQTLTAANGVVAFQNPTFSSPPPTSGVPFQLMFHARGTIGGFDGATGTPIQPSATYSAATLTPQDYLTRIGVGAMSPTRLSFDSQGAVTQYDGQLVVVDTMTSGGTITQTNGPTEVPARFSIAGAGTPATVAQFGNDTTTGISWGRYDSGNFAITDRVTGNVVNPGVSIGNINHYVLGPVQTTPTTLPTTGTYAYTLIGGTNPTNMIGTAGTLNSASLSANFTAQTVDAGVNATVGGRTYAASATGVPIMGGIAFEATKPLNGTGLLSVSCTPGCPTATAGRILGAFTGPTGEGAMMAYSLNAGGIPGTATGNSTIGGVAAFKR